MSTMKNFGQMLVKELREELKQRGLPTTGKKAELVARLEAAVASEAPEDDQDVQADAPESDGPATAPEDNGIDEQDATDTAVPNDDAEAAVAPAAEVEQREPVARASDEQQPVNSNEATKADAEPPAAPADDKQVSVNNADGVIAEETPRDSPYEDPASSLSLGSDEPDDTADPVADAETTGPATTAPETQEARKEAAAPSGDRSKAERGRSPVREPSQAGPDQPQPSTTASFADRDKSSTDDTRERALPNKAAKLDAQGRRGPSVNDAGGRHGASENRSHVQRSVAGAPERKSADHRSSGAKEKAPTDQQRSRKRSREIVFEAPQASKEPEPSAKREPVELEVALPRGETRALFIKGLRRPLREPELVEVLSEKGPLEGFWLEKPLKSWCYAVYKSVDVAVQTYKAVNGRKWPERACKSVMDTIFVTLEEAQAVIEGEGVVTIKRPGSRGHARGSAGTMTQLPKQHGDAAIAERDNGAPHIVPKAAVERAVQRDASVVVLESDEEGDMTEELRTESQDVSERKAAAAAAKHVVAVDDLFRKTVAEPVIFWLPLSDEEVEARAAVERARASGQQNKGVNGSPASPRALKDDDQARPMSVDGS